LQSSSGNPQTSISGLGLHIPIPSQYLRSYCVTWQDVLHNVPMPWSWQTPLSHRPVVPQVVGDCVGQRASAVPFGTVVHVPSLPATRQLWQVAVQLLSPQQTPSVQWVLPHSPSRPHAVPSVSFRTQLPLSLQ
jgi:hypothetical protein